MTIKGALSTLEALAECSGNEADFEALDVIRKHIREHRKTVRTKRPIQQRKAKCIGLVPTDMNHGGRCWRCKGKGILSPNKSQDEIALKLLKRVSAEFHQGEEFDQPSHYANIVTDIDNYIAQLPSVL